MTYGVNTTGFSRPTLAAIIEEITASLKSKFGPEFSCASDTAAGQIVGVFADRISSVWQQLENVYTQFDPNEASGISLDNVAAFVNLDRQAAAQSTVTVTLTGTPGLVVPANNRFAVTGSGATFYLTADATIGVGGTVDADCLSTEYGAIQAPSGTLITIVDPISGLTAVTNADDATPGRLLESDSAFRYRRDNSLSLPGSGTLKSIQANVLNVDGVTASTTYENVTDATDSLGLPAHSFQTVVLGGDDAEIAAAIWAHKPAGIRAYGTTFETITDDDGFEHTVGLTRPNELEAWIKVDLVVLPEFNTGNAQVNTIEVQTVTDSAVYSGVLSDKSWSFTSGVGTTEDLIGAGIESAINALELPITATYTVGTGVITLIADYAGNAFSSVVSTANLAGAVIVANSGTQATVANALAEWGDDNLTIGSEFYRSQAYNPVNNTSDKIVGITITTNWYGPDHPWLAADLTADFDEIISLDTQRIIVTTTTV